MCTIRFTARQKGFFIIIFHKESLSHELTGKIFNKTECMLREERGKKGGRDREERENMEG